MDFGNLLDEISILKGLEVVYFQFNSQHQSTVVVVVLNELLLLFRLLMFIASSSNSPDCLQSNGLFGTIEFVFISYKGSFSVVYLRP